MKKFFAVFVAVLLSSMIFTACEKQNYSPVLTTVFESDAVVKTGDFSFNCKICRKKDASVSVTVKNDFIVKSNDISETMDINNINKNNSCIALYNAFMYIEGAENLNAKKVDGGYKYYGKTDLGPFVIFQNSNQKLVSIIFETANLEINFLQ
mgnify:CR=1 FL=1